MTNTRLTTDFCRTTATSVLPVNSQWHFGATETYTNSRLRPNCVPSTTTLPVPVQISSALKDVFVSDVVFWASAGDKRSILWVVFSAREKIPGGSGSNASWRVRRSSSSPLRELCSFSLERSHIVESHVILYCSSIACPSSKLSILSGMNVTLHGPAFPGVRATVSGTCLIASDGQDVPLPSTRSIKLITTTAIYKILDILQLFVVSIPRMILSCSLVCCNRLKCSSFAFRRPLLIHPWDRADDVLGSRAIYSNRCLGKAQSRVVVDRLSIIQQQSQLRTTIMQALFMARLEYWARAHNIFNIVSQYESRRGLPAVSNPVGIILHNPSLGQPTTPTTRPRDRIAFSLLWRGLEAWQLAVQRHPAIICFLWHLLHVLVTILKWVYWHTYWTATSFS